MLPSLLKKHGKLQPAWRYTSEGVIWKIVFTDKGLLVGEARTLDTKQVSFFCIDASTGVLFWEGATFGEQWWIGIEAICGEILFLHKYATPTMPEHKGIIAVDVASGRRMWTHEEMTFEFGTEDFVVASRNSMRGFQFFRLEVATGITSGELSRAEAKSLRHKSTSNIDEASEVKIRTPIFNLDEDFSEHAVVIREHCDVRTIVGPVEFLEQGSTLVFNYHQRSSSSSEEHIKVHNILKIVDRGSGTVLFDTQVHTNSSSVVPESFLVRHDMLYFVREQKTLTAVDLTNLNL